MDKQNIIKSGIAICHDGSEFEEDYDTYGAMSYSLTSDGVLYLLSNEEIPAESAADYVRFQDLDFHTAIVTPGVEDLPYGCLANCKNLHKVVIWDGIPSIHPQFATSSPVEYYVENGLKFLGTESNPHYALMEFADGVTAKKIVIPEGTIEVQQCAFRNQAELSEVIIPRSLSWVKFYAFEGTSVKELYIPDGSQLPPGGLEEIWLLAFDCLLRRISVPYNFYEYYLAQKDDPLPHERSFKYGAYEDCEVTFRNPDGTVAEVVRGPESVVRSEPEPEPDSPLPLTDDELPF